MDFRDIFRGFFGLYGHPRHGPPNGLEDDNHQVDPPENSPEQRLPRDFFGSTRRPNSFFGDIFSTMEVMEDMFKEMEQSMNDLDTFFQDLGDQKPPLDFGIRSPLYQEDDILPTLPPPSRKSSDINVRDYVLKSPEVEPLDKSKKVDKDVDDLYAKSILPLADIPLPPKESSETGIKRFNSKSPPAFRSSFERVYSTYSFRNGQWEGKTIRENQDGKEITSYERNLDGELKETTKFIPSANSNGSNGIVPAEPRPLYFPFAFFEKFFKP